MNFFRGVLEEDGGRLAFRNEEWSLIFSDEWRKRYERAAGRRVVLGIRPHHMQDAALLPESPGWSRLTAKVELIEPMGNEVVLLLSRGGMQFRAVVDPHTEAKMHNEMEILIDLTKIHLFDEKTEEAIR
jgi:multiple sugar transport system ATP-binding protein